jgi:toxin CptA
LSSQAFSLALIFLLALPPLWLSLVRAPALRVDVGAWGDHTYLSGVNAIESGSSEDYRWTTGRATLLLPNISQRYQLLRLRAHGWRPDGGTAPAVRLDAAGAGWGSLALAPEMRVYSILLPRDGNSPNVAIGLSSQVYAEPTGRQLGIALDWLELRALGSAAGPTLWQFGGQMLLLGLLALVLWALRLPDGWAAALAALLSAAVVWANLRQPLWVSQALAAWLALAGLLLLATWLLAPRLRGAFEPWLSPGQARMAWALLVAALALRLAGALHPLFNAHDLDVHTGWLEAVSQGQLYLYSTPGEFRGQQTFNPPAGYLLLLPLGLALPDERLVVQVGLALVDGLGCLVLLALARELGLPALAALLALALYLALPINTTMLWWGFVTNALAQTLGLLLLWALLRLIRQPASQSQSEKQPKSHAKRRLPSGRRQENKITGCGFASVAALREPFQTTSQKAALFGVALAAALLTHVGALALTAAMIGLCVTLGWRRVPPQSRAALIGGLLAVGALAALLYFSAAIGPLLGRRAPGLDLGQSFAKAWAARDLRASLIASGPLLGFLPITLALAPAGLVLLLGVRTRSPLRSLVAAWLVVCLVFLAADFGLGLVVRYVYFAAPLICLAVGAVLAALWSRPAGRLVAVALALLVAWSGTALWVAGVLERVKPSVLPLTH